MFPPLPNLVRMNPIFTGYLDDGLLTFDRLQGHPGLKGRFILSSFHTGHFTIPPRVLWQAISHLITLSSFWGALQLGREKTNFVVY